MQFQMGGQQVEAPRWPRGTPQEISKAMSWLKGTEWQWNRDQWTMKLDKSGDVEAPVQQCQGGGCKWSADKGKFYVLLGDAGLLTFDTEDKKPANMKGMRMKGRMHADNSRITLTFQKVFDYEAENLDKDLYGAMGLPDDADENDIKKVYRKLSIKYHPDKNPDADAREKFDAIRDAYEILSDPDKKILYDTGGMEAVKKGEKGEIEKTDDFASSTDVTLEQLYNGMQTQVDISRRVVCRGCHLRPDAPQCKGCNRCPNEVKVVNVRMGPFMTQQQQEVTSKQKCKSAGAKLDMHIERGMRDGEVLTFQRMADQRPGMLPGNVNLKLKSAKHRLFERRGDNLHMTLKVSLQEALLGWSQTIRHLDGHSVELETTSVTKHLQVIKVKDEGMPLRDDPASFGDLLVKVEVTFPKKLDARQRELVETIFQADPPRKEL